MAATPEATSDATEVRREAPLVFVVGVPRSGTTMLSAMMNAHSRVSIAPEMHYFTQYWPRARAALEPGGEGAIALVDYLLTTPTFQDMHLTAAEVDRIRREISEQPAADHRTIYTAFVRAYAARKGKTIFGEKTPAYLVKVPTLEATLAGSRYLCIVRDPRDVSLSRRTSKMRGGPLYHALVWRQFSKQQGQAASRLGDRLLVLRYEDLVADPRSQLTRCCELLGVPFEEQMLEFHTATDRNFDAAREPWKLKALTPVDPTNVEKWRQGLPAAHIAIIELILRDRMDKAGYERSRQPLTPALLKGMARSIARDVRIAIATWRRHRVRKAGARGREA